MLNAVPALIK